MKLLDQSDIDCMIEVRNACSVIFMILDAHGLTPEAGDLLTKAGVKNGFVARFRELIDRPISDEYVKFVVEDKLNETP